MEHAFIAWLKRRAGQSSKVTLGIGDDAAVLPSDPSDWVVTTDSLCEGSHFRVAECGPRAVGRKLAAVNLSDLASMAATPHSFFLSLCLPRSHAASYATEIAEGVLAWADRFDVALAGGDTNVWDGPLVVHLTALGLAPEGGCWTRRGARAGDVIVVSGHLGGSLAGKHLDFTPRVDLARALRARLPVHAATDISDGFGVDLLSITSASGLGAEVELDRIPISEAARAAAGQSGRSALDHALGDGEDFELLMAIPQSALGQLPSEIDGVPLTPVGRFVSRTGLWRREGGKVHQLPASGYVHGVKK